MHPLEISGQFAGVILHSPWVTFDTTSNSFAKNRLRDLLDARALRIWSALFQGSAPSDNYLEPLKAPADWWKDLPADNFLVTAGAHEIFLDDIQDFTKKFQSVQPKVTYVVAPDGVHDELTFAGMMNLSTRQQQLVLEEWLLSTLGV